MDKTVEANVQVFEHPNAVRIEIIITGANHAARLELKADLLDAMGVAGRTVQTKKELLR